MERSEILGWLRETSPGRLESLWHRADRVRQEHVGGEVHLRGLIEVSNYCVRQCLYCGLRAGNAQLPRYRMTPEEVLNCARLAVQLGYGTVVLQAGEDDGLDAETIAGIVRQIKAETPLAVTLSLGERSPDELALWRRAGADRYLLRFETSNRTLYERIHPPRRDRNYHRLELLAELRRLGYQVGSGVMIGIPGQTYADLATDIALFAELDLDMIGVGPYLPHPFTPMGGGRVIDDAGDEQVPADELTTYKVIALARLVCPRSNIPATTALATLNRRSGRELGLTRGANVVMPNLTPARYRQLYEIYPNKACVSETAEDCHGCLRGRIAAIGRTVGRGRGDAVRGTVPLQASTSGDEFAPQELRPN